MYDAVVRERDRVFAGLEPTEVESLSRALDRVDENLREILALDVTQRGPRTESRQPAY